MTGRRNDLEPHLYEPGDYGRWQGRWYCRPPSTRGFLGDVTGHKVETHDDGTITVSPSILIKCRDLDGEFQWHGFLERGVWREC